MYKYIFLEYDDEQKQQAFELAERLGVEYSSFKSSNAIYFVYSSDLEKKVQELAGNLKISVQEREIKAF